jgi:hypothetical protein
VSSLIGKLPALAPWQSVLTRVDACQPDGCSF